MTALAKKQTVVINVASLSFSVRVPGCHVKDDSVDNESDSGNECCLLSSGMRVPGCHGGDDTVGNEADSGNECCLL